MRRIRTLLFSLSAVGGTVAIFLVIRHLGGDQEAPEAGALTRLGRPPPVAANEVLVHVLLALVVILVAARLLGILFRWLKQPPVLGEVIAGILLGPSLLGRLAPDVSNILLPPSAAPFLGVIAQVGIILYMFLVGLELDTALLRKRTRAMIATSQASIIVPFLLGSALALWLYPVLSTREVPFTPFALFMGVSMSVTAFPVLARILTDRGMSRSRLGAIALACAAINDATAWCLLALVVGVTQSEPGRIVVTIALTVGFTLLMLGLVRPAAHWFLRRHEQKPMTPQGTLSVVCIGLLLAALATELIGIHALFGAFLLGVVVPHNSKLSRDVTAKLEDVVVVLLLPAFFAFTGLRTQIGLVSGFEQWLICGVIVLVASLGKFGGSALAARFSGMRWRDAASLGVLMNTRGLMELIVLNVGLDLGVISPTLFAMLVIMAVVTTLATSPILQALVPRAQAAGVRES